MATAEEMGDPRTWETARALGKQLNFPVGPYDPRVPTPDEMNAVLPYLLNRATTFYEPKYFCANAELALANLLGVTVPRQGFPKQDGFSRHGYDWEGFNRRGLDMNGYNREGYDSNGFNKEGYNKAGLDYYGFDKEGYNAKGVDRSGHTREEAVQVLVGKWSPEFAAAIAAHVAELQVQQPAGDDVIDTPEVPKKVAKKAAVKKAAPAKAAVKKAAPAKAPGPKKVTVRAAKKAAPAAPRNPLTEVAPRRRDHILFA
jgi:hypothetical protein